MRVLTVLGLALSFGATAVAAAQQAAEPSAERPPVPARVSIHVGALRQASPFAYGGGGGTPPIRFAASGTVLGARLGTSLADGIAIELAGSLARDATLRSEPHTGQFFLSRDSRVTISELTLAARFAPARACLGRVCGNFSVGAGVKRYDFAKSDVAYDDSMDSIEPDQATATFLFGVGVRLPLRGTTVMVDVIDTTNPLRHRWDGSASNPHDVSLQFGIEKALRRRTP